MKTRAKVGTATFGVAMVLIIGPQIKEKFSPTPDSGASLEDKHAFGTALEQEVTSVFLNDQTFNLGRFTVAATKSLGESTVAIEQADMLADMDGNVDSARDRALASCALAAANNVITSEDAAGARWLAEGFARADELCLEAIRNGITSHNITALVTPTGLK
jgi:hypothetical protein